MVFPAAFHGDNLWPALAVTLTFIGIVGWVTLANRKRYPDAPWLRVSKKPGRLGLLEDQSTFLRDSTAILNVGWERYSKHGLNYLLDTPEGVRYIVAQKYFDELVRAPDSHISALLASNTFMQVESTLHKIVAIDQFHFDLPIKKSLTQALGPKLADIVDEAKLAINEFIGDAKDRTRINGLEMCFNIVTRTANRLLFNIPLTRNKEFHKLSVDYTFVMFGGADKVRKWPGFFKPIVMWWSTNLYETQATARRLLMPFIEERVKAEKSARAKGIAKTRQKEDDMVQWIMDYASDEELHPNRLFYRMLHINIAAVHTSSSTFAEVLYAAIIFPQYQNELRQEIIDIFRQEGGWSKQALTLLYKMDSFMTECSRIQPNASLKNARVALKDWQFKDGTFIPKGTHIFTNQIAYHMQEDVFENANEFDPWRMYKLRSKQGEELKHQYVMTSDKNLHFGHGKHACPGRFFAANEVKTLLVLLLMRFDMTLESTTWDEIRRGLTYAVSRNPLDNAVIEFHNRTDQIPEDLKAFFV
ncbi:hypothetical protein N7490_008269 [Penicillium lividum]|nr:hypothetical protein N7490_008269 [Penicillium lividum]